MKGIYLLKKNNKGVGIVTVIIALSFLAAIGLLIMALSYTSSEMRSSERTGREVAYNAADVVEQLRSGVELAVSDSIRDCYTQVMTNYSFYRGDIEKKFDLTFNEFLNDWKPYNVESGLKSYYTDNPKPNDKTFIYADGINFLCGDVDTVTIDGTSVITHKGYNVKALEKFVKVWFAGEADITCLDADGEPTGNVGVAQWEWEYDNSETPKKKAPKRVVLKDIRVSYRKLLRTVTITTDIAIDFPDLGYIYNEITSPSQFTEFAAISLKDLELNNGYGYIQGKAYVGGVNISSAGNSHRFELIDAGTLITPGAVKVKGNNDIPLGSFEYHGFKQSDGGIDRYVNDLDGEEKEVEDIKAHSSFIIENSATLWAKEIDVLQNGKIALCYNAYVKNDLNLVANEVTALVTGNEYYGFGNGRELDSAMGTPENPDISSAILIQGRNTNLNLYGLNRLTLAGFAFIGDSKLNGWGKTSQSMAVKKDQIAYLAPVEMVEHLKTNPEVFNNADDFDDFVQSMNTTPNNQVTINGNKHPSDYGMTIKAARKPYNGYEIGYFFMDFDTVEHRNQYFRDYFSTHKEEIVGYLNQYLNLTDTTGTFGAVGSVYTLSGDEIGLRNTISDPDSESKYKQYSNLLVTLSGAYGPTSTEINDVGKNNVLTETEKADRSSAANPFEFFVKEQVIKDALDRAETNEIYFRDIDGNNVALITRDLYEVKKDVDEHLCLIISINESDNAVKVMRDFNGLIMCKGGIYIDVSETQMDSENEHKGQVWLQSNNINVLNAMKATAYIGSIEAKHEDFFKNYFVEDHKDKYFQNDSDDQPNHYKGIFAGKENDAVMIYEFLYCDYTPAGNNLGDQNDGSYWNVNTLVYFDRWKKD